MTEIKIKPLSINKAYRGRRFKTKEYAGYETELYYQLPDLQIPEGKLQVQYIFGLSNKRADWDNPIKAFQDILQKKYLFDDNRIYKAIVEKVDVKRGEEFVSFEIRGCEGVE